MSLLALAVQKVEAMHARELMDVDSCIKLLFMVTILEFRYYYHISQYVNRHVFSAINRLDFPKAADHKKHKSACSTIFFTRKALSLQSSGEKNHCSLCYSYHDFIIALQQPLVLFPRVAPLYVQFAPNLVSRL